MIYEHRPRAIPTNLENPPLVCNDIDLACQLSTNTMLRGDWTLRHADSKAKRGEGRVSLDEVDNGRITNGDRLRLNLSIQ